MKAISYLQRIGAIPDFNLKDLQLAVIAITGELFEKGMMVEPDCVQWTQDSSHDEDSPWDSFSKRCDIIAHATEGDVEGLVPLISKVDSVHALKRLIEDLLEIRLFYLSFLTDEDPLNQESHQDEWFVRLYNQLVALEKGEDFQTKTQILHFFYSGALTPVGENLLKLKGVKL
jgi:hypothetical protein